MGTVRGGRIICDSCGRDCTRLYGMRFDQNRNMSTDREVQKEFKRIEEIFGKREFVFCWECSVKAFGAKPLKPTIEELTANPTPATAHTGKMEIQAPDPTTKVDDNVLGEIKEFTNAGKKSG